MEEVERKRPTTLRDLLQRLLELDRLPLGKGNRPNSLFDLRNRSIAQIFPAAEARLKMLHYLIRHLSLGARREQRIDELLQRAPCVALHRLTVVLQQTTMNLLQTCIDKERRGLHHLLFYSATALKRALQSVTGDADLRTRWRLQPPSHARCIVRKTDTSIRSKQDDPAMPTEPVEEIVDGCLSGR